MKILYHFFSDESGVSHIEYAVIATLITVVIISGVSAVGNGVGNLFNYAMTKGVPPLK